jgi:hypothetical protein
MRECGRRTPQDPEIGYLDLTRVRELMLRQLASDRAHPVEAPTEPVPDKALVRLIAVTDIADGDASLARGAMEDLGKSAPELVANMANCNEHLASGAGSDEAPPSYAGEFATSCSAVWKNYEKAFEYNSLFDSRGGPRNVGLGFHHGLVAIPKR